ncbi:MAG: A/G-specific adenine glycosylase [Candidatus Sungbacteria bacterium]|nr:A/G-specific adenine glycosylase [Candidatus Sungbacteria bacterium]
MKGARFPRKLQHSGIESFRKYIWDYAKQHRRDLPWRNTCDPYRIVVSEVMLQQTQVSRVLAKYPEFIDLFPNVSVLAQASLPAVLRAWQGMGYNRRALALKRLGEDIVQNHAAKIPSDPDVLCTLPGIGNATAGAIGAFAFNKPAVFIETNIRRVFIHFFFPNSRDVADREIHPLVEKTLDFANPREWYYALMDYGAALGRNLACNPNRKSRHYHAQSRFRGSDRQLRGSIIALALDNNVLTCSMIARKTKQPEVRITPLLKTLTEEGFLQEYKGVYST